MCVDSEKGKPLGFLYKNQHNQFVYTCVHCDDEFFKSFELEQHTMIHNIKNSPAMVSESLPIEFPSAADVPIKQDNPLPILDKMEMAVYLPALELPEKTIDEPNRSNESATDDIFDNVKFDSDSSSSDPNPFDGNQMNTNGQRIVNRRTYICELCARSFTSLARIRQHIHATHVTDKKKPTKQQPTPVVCELCQKTVKDMKTHLKYQHSNERPHKCKYCVASFKQKVHLDTHTRQHEGLRPFICDRCGKGYHGRSTLKAHINRFHLRLRPHKCDQCPNTYRQLYELRDHINLHHLNKKLYPCLSCDRSFGTRKHLHQHMLSHGEKRYSCRLCDQKFATTSGRRGHEIRNHGAI